MTIEDEMNSHYWFHSIKLQDGLITNGLKPPAQMDIELDRVFGMVDVTNKTVLDVGAWTGAFSIEAKRRGAKRVVALDNYTWNHQEFRGREAFDFAVRASGLEIEAVDQDLHDQDFRLIF